MCLIFISYSFFVIYNLLIGGINVSDFHIVGIFNDYYAQIVAVIAIADAEQKEIQTSCNSTAPITYISIKGSESKSKPMEKSA